MRVGRSRAQGQDLGQSGAAGMPILGLPVSGPPQALAAILCDQRSGAEMKSSMLGALTLLYVHACVRACVCVCVCVWGGGH